MTYAEVKEMLQSLGFEESRAQRWALHLTQENREPTREEVANFAKKIRPQEILTIKGPGYKIEIG